MNKTWQRRDIIAQSRDMRVGDALGNSASIWGPSAPKTPSLAKRKRLGRNAFLGTKINHTKA